MDATNPSATPTAASRTPIRIGAVGMIVRNLGGMTAYYRDLLGLEVQKETKDNIILGVGDVTRAIQKAYLDTVRGVGDRWSQWREVVPSATPRAA